MRRLIYIGLCCAALLLSGCQEEAAQVQTPDEAPAKAVTAETESETTESAPIENAQEISANVAALFDEPIAPVVLELPTQALPYWRDAARDEKPVLVYFSIHPLLEPIEPALNDTVLQLMARGAQDDFLRHGSLYRADPVILPTQTLSAAIDADLFAEVFWVFPSTAEPAQMQPELFRKQVTDAGFLTPAEGESLTFKEGIFTGTVRGMPFRAVHPGALPEIEKPMILHFDLGFFKGLYQGEVKTRLYDVLHQTALSLNETGWVPELVTVSYSTMEGTFSLDVRFLITNFVEMLRDPSLLDGTMPQNWALRSEALYAVNFFLDDKVQEYYQQAADEFPDDAAAQYDLYKHLFFEQRKIDEGLEVLDKAVALDPGYAAAYLELAQIASNDNNLPAALELLSKAAPLIPENPMIDLYRAQFLIQSGRKDEAIPLIEELQKLNWSAHYHPNVPELLEEMIKSEEAISEQPGKPG